MPKGDGDLPGGAVLVGEEQHGRGDGESEAEGREEGLGDMGRNGATGRARVDVSARCVHAEEEIQGHDLAEPNELVNGEDRWHGDQRFGVAIPVAFDRPDVDKDMQAEVEVDALYSLVEIVASDMFRKGPHQEAKKVVNRRDSGVNTL